MSHEHEGQPKKREREDPSAEEERRVADISFDDSGAEPEDKKKPAVDMEPPRLS